MLKTSILDIHPAIETVTLKEVSDCDYRLFQYFQDRILVQPLLNRSLVSFQGNKNKPIYRWYKYKEAFSASLVEYLLQKYNIIQGQLLDPFAGSGTALFAASELGIHADGIELLPIGHEIINTKQILDSNLNNQDLARIKFIIDKQIWKYSPDRISIQDLKITKGAYSIDNQILIEKYLATCQQENSNIQKILKFALLCILESISYTRKDGQYLRWDYRSEHHQGKQTFDKGNILDFSQAITNKLKDIVYDLSDHNQQGELFSLFSNEITSGKIHLYQGSCLEILPDLVSAQYDVILTSPPYCNRYDYTRTYALELALLGITENELTKLRQTMLSCTVENRSKDLLAINPKWKTPLAIAEQQILLQTILKYLENQRQHKKLNNNGIPRMIKGYFYEMACVIYECFRVLKSGSFLFMVNDNVQYSGMSISVDMILSDFAEKIGFTVENILVLSGDKGNSSQQMGDHGRIPLRKCIYIWKKL